MKYKDKGGNNRIGILAQCQHCGNEFITRVDQPGKYCSVPCRNAGGRKRVTVKCAQCSAAFEKHVSDLALSKSGLYFCTRACKNKAQRIGGIEAIMPPHFGTGKKNDQYRRVYREACGLEKLSCRRCGYNEFECGVDVHHIDGNRKNNAKENLISLCSPCHRALHYNFWSLTDLTD